MMRTQTGIVLLVMALASGCGCDEGGGRDADGGEEDDGEVEAGGDVTDGDALPEPEQPAEDAVEEPDPADTPRDGDAEETDGDAEDVEEEEGPYDPSACTMPPEIPEDPVDPALNRFALQMLHFNIQYVAGGLEGFCPSACDYDESETEDLIIRESFVPILDFYLAHPGWKVDIELPSYMIEVMAARFPDDLHKLQILTWRGQVSLISFHYSAQLFLAFPSRDEEESAALTREVFERYCLPLSTVVFNQEGEFGEGRQAFMASHGYGIGIFPRNLFEYVKGPSTPIWPYYTLRGTDVVVGPAGVDPSSGIEVTWPFFDDGETLAVAGDLDPYFGDLFRYDPAKMTAYETQLADLEAAGYKVTTIKDYVNHLKARGLAQPDVGPVLDGTWQPGSTDGLHRWMGGMGVTPWSGGERDNEVRTRNASTRTLLDAAGILVDYTEDTLGVDYGAYRASVKEAWRHLLFAEVTDATGINPWSGEIAYSLGHCDQADFIADFVVSEMKGDLGTPFVSIDTLTRSVEELDTLPPDETYPVVPAPIVVQVAAANRTIATTWYDTGSASGTTRYRLVIDFSAASGISEEGRTLSVSFPYGFDRIVFSPGLLESELVDYAQGDFIFEEGKHWLPLPNGIIGIDEGWYVIKHTRSVHLSALLRVGAATIDFVDNTQPRGESATWVFEIFSGSPDEALDLANRINVWPVVTR